MSDVYFGVTFPSHNQPRDIIELGDRFEAMHDCENTVIGVGCITEFFEGTYDAYRSFKEALLKERILGRGVEFGEPTPMPEKKDI
jgi:hypothetical protein